VNLDHEFSKENQISGRFFTSLATTNEPFNPFAATVPGFGTNDRQRNDMFVLADTHAFNPNWVNVALFGFMRFNGLMNGISPITPAAVGTQAPAGLPTIPGIAVQGLFTIGPGYSVSSSSNTNTIVWQDTLSLTRGKHSLRMGGEAKRHQLDVATDSGTGYFSFLSFPDFLLGESAAQNGSGQSNIFLSAAASGLFRKDERYTDLAGFLQDDIRLTARLTLNAGLRYEYFGPPNEIHGRLSNFDPTVAAHVVPRRFRLPRRGWNAEFFVRTPARRPRSNSLPGEGATPGKIPATWWLQRARGRSARWLPTGGPGGCVPLKDHALLPR
jgi:outer membrane receptor protein involved in Fe transport